MAELKRQVRSARFAAQQRANTGLVRLYWVMGRTILDRQQVQVGANVTGARGSAQVG